MLMLTGVVVVELLASRAASLDSMMKTQGRNQKFIWEGGVFFRLFRPFSSYFCFPSFPFPCCEVAPHMKLIDLGALLAPSTAG